MLRCSRFFWLGQQSTFFPYPALEYHIIAYAIFREYFFGDKNSIHTHIISSNSCQPNR